MLNLRHALFIAPILAGLALTGCAGRETFIYKSTASAPKTITLVDWTKGETLWTYEIPVGEQLKVQFVERATNAEGRGYDTMEWISSPLGETAKGPKSNMRVPPPTERRLEMHLRHTPEGRGLVTPVPTTTPTAAAPAPQPTPEPAPAAPAPKPAKKTTEGIVLPDPKQAAPK